MLRFDLEHVDGIADDMLPDKPRKRKRDVELPNADLNRHFPSAGYTEITIICFILDECSRVGVQPVVSADKPKKGVSVQKKLHDGM